MNSMELIKNRIKQIRRRLGQNNANALLITNPANVSYVTNFSGDDSWSLITNRNVYFVTDSRYTEQAQTECLNCQIIERSESMSQAVAGLVDKLSSVKIMAVEKSITMAAFQAVKKKAKVKLEPVEGVVEFVRMTKDDSEIKNIKTAVSISGKALKQTLGKIKAGVSENELAAILDFHIRKLGATNSFETIVAFGANGSCPHHHPTNRKLKKNDSVLIDFGAKYKGYCSDITRCFTVGKATSFYQKAYEVVRLAQAAAIEIIKAGVAIKDVDAAARKVVAQNGFPVYGHGTGHGIGLDIHEAPVVSRKSKEKLMDGQVITIEPGIYISGKLGIRIEDDVLVTKSGCQILSKSS